MDQRRRCGHTDLLTGYPGQVRSDGGQAIVVVAAVLALVVVLGLGAVRLAGVVADRARAHSAADAAALAGVVEGREGAERLAASNGGHVTGFERSGAEVEVRVRVGQAEAVARARLERFTVSGS
jgi:Flp pilus assembly protein TadG